MIYTADNLGEFKATMKSAFENWISSLITSADELPSAMKTILNRASNNIIHRYENEIEKVFDTIAVLFGNESGAIDTDVIANDLLNLINIPARSTTIAGFNITFGESEISVEISIATSSNKSFNKASKALFIRSILSSISFLAFFIFSP